MLLHTVNKTADQGQALQLCLRFADPGDTVLLIEDGVFASTAEHPAGELLRAAKPRILVLLPDLESRGIGHTLAPFIGAITYSDFVDLVCSCDKVQSWV